MGNLKNYLGKENKMLDFESWKESMQKLFKESPMFKEAKPKSNNWISGQNCFSCGAYLGSHIRFETMTGCPYCNRSFLD